MSSTDFVLRLLQKKFHHQLNEISVEEILEVMREMSVEMGLLKGRMDMINDNQKFLESLLMNRLKDGVE